MSEKPPIQGGIHIGRDNINSPINTGSGDQHTTYEEVVVPDKSEVDITLELLELVKLLTENLPDGLERTTTIAALESASSNATDDDEGRNTVGKALEFAVGTLNKTSETSSQIEAVRPHIVRAVGWLGGNWKPLLTAVGASATNFV